MTTYSDTADAFCGAAQLAALALGRGSPESMREAREHARRALAILDAHVDGGEWLPMMDGEGR